MIREIEGAEENAFIEIGPRQAERLVPDAFAIETWEAYAESCEIKAGADNGLFQLEFLAE
jgi:hypothetical protein